MEQSQLLGAWFKILEFEGWVGDNCAQKLLKKFVNIVEYASMKTTHFSHTYVSC